MSLLQGNTYLLPIKINDIDISQVQKAQFIVGKVEKFYGNGGSVTYDEDSQAFLVPLTEEETFGWGSFVKWQARILFTNGEVDGTRPMAEDVIESITKTTLTPTTSND